jgi:hypothetical protein
VLSIFPIVGTVNPASFTAKVILVVGGLNGVGAWYFRRANKRRASLAAA